MIKIEQESFATSTNGDVIKFLTNFHDDESSPEPLPEIEPTSSQLLQYVDQMLDIRTTPMKEIQEFLQENYHLEESEMRCMTAGILRKKRILKREKAKSRRNCDWELVKLEANYIPTLAVPGIVDLTYDECEKKKKRNRISAQISRDRKKQYLIELEDENKRLSQKTETYHKQNQDLKRTLDELRNQNTQVASEASEPKNKFSKLLVFLGIIFLFSCFKDILPSAGIASVMKPNRKGNSVSISSEEQSSLLGKVQNLFGDFSSEFSHIGGPLKIEVGKKIASLKKKSNPMMMPAEIYEGLLYSTDSISN